jgi:hypothetical protein
MNMNPNMHQNQNSHPHTTQNQNPNPNPNSQNPNQHPNQNPNQNNGLFYQQLQQLQQLQQMQSQQPYYNTFQQPLVTQNLFLINQIAQPSPQWPQQQTPFRTPAPTASGAPNPWSATAPLSFNVPQQHLGNYSASNVPHGFNL